MKTNLLLISLLMAFFTVNGQTSELDREDEHMTSNLGGKHEAKRLFEQEFVYPAADLQNKIGGKVVVAVKVKADSSVKEFRVIKSVSPEIDKEALRVLKLFKWQPGKEIGRPIETETSVTFNFQPNKFKDICKRRGYEKPIYPGTPDTSLKVYTKVEEFPKYIDGNDELGAFIQKNLTYPAEMANTNLRGEVILEFIVEPDGLPSNINIKKSLGAGCDQEAIRVLEMIKFKPGKKKDMLVRTYMTMPFTFGLNRSFR